MFFYLVHAYGREIVERLGKTSGGNIVGRSCLELVREVVEGGLLEGYGLYHVATAHVRGHLIQPLLLAVEDADTCGAVRLVSGEGKEIAIHLFNVHGKVRCALCSVYQHRYIVLVCYVYDVLYGVYCSQNIAHVGYGHQLGALVEESLVRLHVQASVVRHGDDTQTYAGACLCQLP